MITPVLQSSLMTNLAGDKNMTDKVKELRKLLQMGWRAALPNSIH